MNLLYRPNCMFAKKHSPIQYHQKAINFRWKSTQYNQTSPSDDIQLQKVNCCRRNTDGDTLHTLNSNHNLATTNANMQSTDDDSQRRTYAHCMQLLPDEQTIRRRYIVCTMYVLVVYTLTINNTVYKFSLLFIVNCIAYV